MRLADDGLWRTTTTADGPATVRIAVEPRRARIRATDVFTCWSQLVGGVSPQ